MHIYIYYLYCSILGLFCFALPPSSIMRCLAPPLLHLLYTATPNSLSRVLVMLLLLLVAVCCRCRHRSTAVRRHNTPTNMRYTFCKMNKGFILRCTRYLHDACCVLCSKTTAGLPGGLVGYPRAYYTQFREFNSHRVHILVGAFSCIKID